MIELYSEISFLLMSEMKEKKGKIENSNFFYIIKRIGIIFEIKFLFYNIFCY